MHSLSERVFLGSGFETSLRDGPHRRTREKGESQTEGVRRNRGVGDGDQGKAFPSEALCSFDKTPSLISCSKHMGEPIHDLWPEQKTKVCQFCREVITLLRQGDGSKRFGLVNHWYISTHRCAGRQTLTTVGAKKHSAA